MTDIVGGILSQLSSFLPTKEVQTVVVKEVQEMALTQGRNFIRVAGLSGGLAVIMSAYGAHAFNSQTEDTRLKHVFESGNKMHLIHSVALLAVPLTRRPKLVGGLMTSGLLLFSGTCYYQAMTGDGRVRKATPYGGILLILSWFAMIL
ncbi:transmembrane protein 256 homolog [Ruditapes philippinarum]|uniref:transmembrane protein 256 homolog n=1 Tax=Ruditapes philippinarum TaxID=129788 RepID=UPI00295A9788|nr:transmembrane protein 256 homolog [Ruditapes philippinarum]